MSPLGLTVTFGILVLATRLAPQLGPASRRARRRLPAARPAGSVRADRRPEVGWRLPRWSRAVVDRLTRSTLERRYERDLPVALEALARALRGGTPLGAALTDAADTVTGPLSDDLRAAGRDLRQGRPTTEVLHAWRQRRPTPGVRLAVAALVVGTELGGSRARAVDRVAAGLRARLAAGREVRALASQARLSAVVIVVAPVVFALFGLTTSAEMASFLFADPLGWACLVGGVALDAAAAWWMVRIVEGAS